MKCKCGSNLVLKFGSFANYAKCIKCNKNFKQTDLLTGKKDKIKLKNLELSFYEPLNPKRLLILFAGANASASTHLNKSRILLNA